MLSRFVCNRAGVVTFYDTRWWAERGMIHWETEDPRTGKASYGKMSVELFEKRLEQGIEQRCKNYRASKGFKKQAWDNVDHKIHAEFVREGKVLIAKAREQGDPYLAESLHHRQLAAPKSVSMRQPTTARKIQDTL